MIFGSLLIENGLSGPSTADVGPVDGRCRARQRQNVWLSGCQFVGPVDSRCQARQRQTVWLSGLSMADVGPVDSRHQSFGLAPDPLAAACMI